MYTSYLKKNLITTATKQYTGRLGEFFLRFSADICSFTSFLPICVIFDPSTTATSCQDADLFPGIVDK